MKHRQTRTNTLKTLIVLLTLFTVLITYSATALGESSPEYLLHVTAKLLNGRATPSKDSFVASFFDKGDTLEPTGRWSKDYQWVEVVGGETAGVWVYIKYVTERVHPFLVRNDSSSKIKIRSHPVNGRITGYLKKGKETEITQVVLGWGRCSKGWIDMSLLTEIN